jgi:hypothetical protein
MPAAAKNNLIEPRAARVTASKSSAPEHFQSGRIAFTNSI